MVGRIDRVDGCFGIETVSEVAGCSMELIHDLVCWHASEIGIGWCWPGCQLNHGGFRRLF